MATQVGDEAQALDILLEGSKPKEMEQIEVDITLQGDAFKCVVILGVWQLARVSDETLLKLFTGLRVRLGR